MTPPSPPNNRPTYAPDRRAGDPLKDLAGHELVILAVALDDAFTIAALVESGAAALKYAPGRITNAVELNARRRDYRLGAVAARHLRAEAERLRAKREHAHRAANRKDRRK